LPEPEGEADDEADSVALAQRQGQDAVDLLGLKRIDFEFFDTRRLAKAAGLQAM
jgi:hypothetical protein